MIIDCTEIFIEWSKILEARAQVWSNYKKSHSTVKYLIGITPQGTVSFVSEGWGGRVSDKEITETSDILQYLLPGDMILADRGFTISDYAGLVCAEVKIPAFTRGKAHLEQKDVDRTREKPKVRIPIERVIGLIKNKFLILKSTLPISLLHKRSQEQTTIDKLTHTCCALTNLCGPLVPLD